MLQVKEEKEHWLLSDERIRLFFVDPRLAVVYLLVVDVSQHHVCKNSLLFS